MTLLCDHTTLGSNRGNHGPVVGAPVAPRIAVAVRKQSVMRTASAVTVNAKAVSANTTEAAAKVITAKAITSTTATMAAASGKCACGKPGASEKDNCNNNHGLAQH